MSDPVVELDPNVVAAKQAARYLQMIAQLVEQNAQLEAYVQQLQVAARQPDQSDQPDS